MKSHGGVTVRRGIRPLLSPQALRTVRYIPTIILTIKNWPTFILTYAGLRNRAAVFTLRNGTTITILTGIDSATVMGVFIREDYGRIQAEQTVIDIGANIGIFSLFAATTGQGSRVYAYEPIPASFEALQHNIWANGLEQRVEPVRQGVAAAKGHRDIYLGPGSPFSSFYKGEDEDQPMISVDCVSLADIFDKHKLNQCDLLKLDCERAEFEILYNTPAPYLERIKQIRLEYHEDAGQPGYNIEALIAFLEAHGFIIAKLDIHVGQGLLWAEREERR